MLYEIVVGAKLTLIGVCALVVYAASLYQFP